VSFALANLSLKGARKRLAQVNSVANVNRPINIITQPGPGRIKSTIPIPMKKNPAKNTAVFQAASAILLARMRAQTHWQKKQSWSWIATMRLNTQM